MKEKFIFLFLLVLITGCTGTALDFERSLSKIAHERTSIEDLEPHLRDAVLKGESLMDDPGLGTNGLSCAACHPNPERNIKWASLFPRRWSTPRNPEPKIITLDQHNFGAMNDMMAGDMDPEAPTFTYLTAYITWLADGRMIWEEDLPGKYLLEESIVRGMKLFQEELLSGNDKSCKDCHSEASMGGSASVFPRYSERYEKVVTLDTFIKTHMAETQMSEIGLDSQDLADLSAFLTNQSRGFAITLEKG